MGCLLSRLLSLPQTFSLVQQTNVPLPHSSLIKAVVSFSHHINVFPDKRAASMVTAAFPASVSIVSSRHRSSHFSCFLLFPPSWDELSDELAALWGVAAPQTPPLSADAPPGRGHQRSWLSGLWRTEGRLLPGRSETGAGLGPGGVSIEDWLGPQPSHLPPQILSFPCGFLSWQMWLFQQSTCTWSFCMSVNGA